MQRPYIVCHIMTSADGRARVPAGAAAWDYRAALEELSVHTLLGDGTMSNRSLPGAFQAKTRTALGYESFKKMTQSPAYDIVVDERGGLFKDAAEGGKPCLVITAQSAAREYLAFLQSRGISWIASGEDGVDFSRAAAILRCRFGVERMAVTGGGAVNAAFLRAGLIDELSILVQPAIGGSGEVLPPFAGTAQDCPAVTLALAGVKTFASGTVWLRYKLK